jgi:hypothetical protein
MSDYGNPYLPPQAEQVPYRSRPEAGFDGADGGDGGDVRDAVVEQLRNTRPWVIFMAVVGFMSAALTALIGVGVMALPALGSKDTAGTATAVGIIYIVIGALCVWPSVGLLRFGSAIGRLVRDPRQERLIVALDLQRSFWKVVGIMSAIMIALIPVSMAVAVAYFAAKALARH